MYTEKPKVLHFSYEMQMKYSEPVKEEYYTIRALPRTDHRQRLLEIKTEITPPAIPGEGTDSFGNPFIYGAIRGEHSYFTCRIQGRVQIGQILFEEPEDENRTPVFKFPYGRNRAGEKLRAYFGSIEDELEENPYVNAVYLMHLLHRDFRYRKDVTDMKTTAEEAWNIGAGVCQDYAHIFIALCHMAGIAARYVTGIITGEGESHAWTEILYRGRWIGMDPTNDLLVAADHIKFAHGRDAADCLVNRGVLRGGGGTPTQLVKVSVSGTEQAT